MPDIIKQLKQAKPHKRKQLLLRMRKKNLRFFSENEGTKKIASVIEKHTVNGYEIKMTDDFLDIVEKKTGHFCHPPGDLLGQAEKLSQPYHTDWFDLVNPLPRVYPESENARIVTKFSDQLLGDNKKQIWQRILSEKIDLPKMDNGRFHSGPVVFLGIFHGLHIVSALKKMHPTNILLIEPEVDSFLLSCYFLDYSKLTDKVGGLNIIVGEEINDNVIAHFFSTCEISCRVWVRFLKVYNDPVFEKIIEKITVYFHVDERFVPFEREVMGLENQIKNIQKPYRLCHWAADRKTKDVVVAGSGPSLKQNLQWLKENRSQLIIIAASSTSTLLKSQGITVDFQTFMELQDVPGLKLDKDIPLVAFVSSNYDFVSRFNEPILFVELNKGNVVKFNDLLEFTHPTSLNAAFSFSRLLQPERLFLLGVDLGSKDEVNAEHLASVLSNKHDVVSSYGINKWFKAFETNFPESEGKIKTNSVFNAVRFDMERCIQEYNKHTRIYNLSDGVKIKGAQPERTETLEFSETSNTGIEQLIASFRVISEQDWSFYPVTAEALLEKLKQEILHCFPKKFGWMSFAESLDVKFKKAFICCCDADSIDCRAIFFYPILQQVLVRWYRYMIYAGSVEEAKALYSKGVQELEMILDELDWPDALKQFEKKG